LCLHSWPKYREIFLINWFKGNKEEREMLRQAQQPEKMGREMLRQAQQPEKMGREETGREERENVSY
jgi:hypothetical protein